MQLSSFHGITLIYSGSTEYSDIQDRSERRASRAPAEQEKSVNSWYIGRISMVRGLHAPLSEVIKLLQ